MAELESGEEQPAAPVLRVPRKRSHWSHRSRKMVLADAASRVDDNRRGSWRKPAELTEEQRAEYYYMKKGRLKQRVNPYTGKVEFYAVWGRVPKLRSYD